jgi:hypothetical protein
MYYISIALLEKSNSDNVQLEKEGNLLKKEWVMI